MLLIVTGNGKGKTTSGLGMVARAMGQDLRCAVIQFIKTNPESCGEYRTFKKLGIEWENYGEGFTWQQGSMDRTKEDCENGFRSFMNKATSGNYDFILLDEFTYVLSMGLLDENSVIDFLKSVKDKIHIVITGRNACEKLVELADTVSSVDEVKHHYNTNGYKTIKGIEY